MSNSELRAVLQCVLAGSAKAALTAALTSALETGLGPACPVKPAAGMSLTLALRSGMESAAIPHRLPDWPCMHEVQLVLAEYA